MQSHWRKRVIVFATVWLTATYFSLAEAQIHTEDAQITVTGTAEVSIPPTDATLSVEVKTSAPSAAAASSDNARISKSVKDALQAAGLRAGEVASSRLTVGPEWIYDETTRRQKHTGFDATNSIDIKTAQLDKLAIYIDSALNAGATGISEIAFSAKEAESARRQALSEAVSDARQDADTLAHAGGGKLGELLLLSTEQPNRSPGVGFAQVAVTARRNEAVSTDVVLPEIKVTATVLARWRFERDVAR